MGQPGPGTPSHVRKSRAKLAVEEVFMNIRANVCCECMKNDLNLDCLALE